MNKEKREVASLLALILMIPIPFGIGWFLWDTNKLPIDEIQLGLTFYLSPVFDYICQSYVIALLVFGMALVGLLIIREGTPK